MDKSSSTARCDGVQQSPIILYENARTNTSLEMNTVEMNNTEDEIPRYVDGEFGATSGRDEETPHDVTPHDVTMTQSGDSGWVENTMYESAGPAKPSELYAEIKQ